MSKALNQRLAALFGTTNLADCSVRFYEEAATSAATSFIGDPLPAHSWALSLGSEFFARHLAQIGGLAGSGASGGGDRLTGSAKRRREEAAAGVQAVGAGWSCEVLVPLGSEAELPHALKALRFIYTGELSQGLGFEALLRVRQQAGYLGVAGCTEACDAALLEWVEAQQSSGDGDEHTDWVAEAYACFELFPKGGGTHEAPGSFGPVLAALQPNLIKHFSDAALVLSYSMRRDQLLRLPACAVEVLLTSNAFTTDSESTVVALVAVWVEDNPEVPAEEVQRLWRHVRLSRVSRPYLNFVLPKLCKDVRLTPEHLGLVQHFATAPARELQASSSSLQQAAREHPAWFASPARPRGPHAGSLTLSWEVGQEELLAASRRAAASGETEYVAADVTLHRGTTPLCTTAEVVLQGLQWQLQVAVYPSNRDSSAARGLGAGAPAAGASGAGRPQEPLSAGLLLANRVVTAPPHSSQQPAGVVSVDATVSLRNRRGLLGQELCRTFVMELGARLGWADAIALGQAGSPQRQRHASIRTSEPPLDPLLQLWAPWLHGGVVGGRLQLSFR